MLRGYTYIVVGTRWTGKPYKSRQIRLEVPALSRKEARKAKAVMKDQGFRTYFARYSLDSMNDKGQ